MIDTKDTESKLITAGVRNLREWGYPKCDTNNIMTDPIYSQFFASMLEDNLGRSNKEIDVVIRSLLQKCNGQKE